MKLKILQNLSTLSEVSLKSSQFLGRTIFSVDARNELHFSWIGLPFICSILWFLYQRLISTLYMVEHDTLMAGLTSERPTEEFSEAVFAVTIYLMDISNFLILLNKRTQIIEFQHRLNTLISTIILDSDYSIENLEHFQSLATTSIKDLRRFKKLVYIFTGITTLSFTLSLVEVYMYTPISLWNLLALFLISASSIILPPLRVISHSWVTGIIHTMRIAAALIRRRLVCKGEINASLRQYQQLEKLLEQFNSDFGFFIALNLLSYVVIITDCIFPMFIWYASSPVWALGTFGGVAMVYLLVLYAWCDAAHELESDWNQFLATLREKNCSIVGRSHNRNFMYFIKMAVTPTEVRPWNLFSLNREAFVSMMEAIATYLVVLFQFLQDESVIEKLKVWSD